MDLSRTNSFDTIPDVDFMIHALDKDLGDMQISEFKTKEMAGLMQPEPLLTADSSRFVLFPIKHSDVRQSTKKIAPVLNRRKTRRLISITLTLTHPDLGNV